MIDYLWSSGETTSRFSIVVLLRFLGGTNLRAVCCTFCILSSLSGVAYGPARVTFEVEKLEDWVIAEWTRVDGSVESDIGDESSLGRKRSISSVWTIRMTEFWMCVCHATFNSIRTRLVISSSNGRQSTVAGTKKRSS